MFDKIAYWPRIRRDDGRVLERALAGPNLLDPGVIIDGAVVTKLVPFALIPVGLALDVEGWAIAVLAAVGAGQIFTDVAFSTKTSDWKKVKRELRAARGKAL